nr:PREDICTED: sphingomyelin phosphodiesterase 2 [Struthio camelus australis]
MNAAQRLGAQELQLEQPHARAGAGTQASGFPAVVHLGMEGGREEVSALAHCAFPSCSGVIGSGLCIFSRFPILDTFLYQYSLNGYPYMLQHGDWFCGKSVGLVVIKISGIIFNIYVTHVSVPGRTRRGRGMGGRDGWALCPRGTSQTGILGFSCLGILQSCWES